MNGRGEESRICHQLALSVVTSLALSRVDADSLRFLSRERALKKRIGFEARVAESPQASERDLWFDRDSPTVSISKKEFRMKASSRDMNDAKSEAEIRTIIEAPRSGA
jgi:hypothetical protein